MWKGCLYVRT